MPPTRISDAAGAIDARNQLASRAASFSVAHRGGLAGASRLVRSTVFASVAWLPLVALVLAQRTPTSFASFARDYSVHVRALAAIPWLIFAERVVDRRCSRALLRFVDAGLLRSADYPSFARSLDRAERLRDSRVSAIGLFVLALAGSVYAAHRSALGGLPAWCLRIGGEPHFTFAGWWYLAVSVPVSQFLLFVWLWRWIIWTGLLWQISRLEIRLLGTHADRAGGIGFLGQTASAFALVMTAPGLLISTTWVHRMRVEHATIQQLFRPMFGFVAVVSALGIAPLVAFASRLRRTQVEDDDRYGALVQAYNRMFDRRWVGPSAPRDDATLATLDAQTLADLGNSYDVIAKMRFLPLDLRALVDLVAATALPLLPPLLTATSPTDIARKLIESLL